MRVLLWIVRALAILLLLRLILRAFFGPKRRPSPGSGGARRPSRTPERIGGELVQDPQCGTYIPKARAVIVGSGDTAAYFCSTECRDKYEKVRRQ